MKRSTAIIIVNWNGENYIEECLSSLEEQTNKDFDIFFVDNDSSDSSLAIAQKHKSLKIIESGGNFGFAKGNNIAISHAIELGYKYIALINPDTVCDKDALKFLIKAVGAKNVGGVQSKLKIYGTDTINTTGNELHYLGFSYCGNYKEPDNKDLITHTQIGVASGAAVIFKSSVLEKSGLLAEDFFMYQEDTDLSWRIRELGYDIIFEPRSVIYHKYNFGRNKNKFYYVERNRLIYILKNYQLKTLVVLSPVFIITELLMIIYALIDGWPSKKVSGYIYLAKHFGEILKERKSIQSSRKVSDYKLKKYWVTTLRFDEVSNPLFYPLNLFFRAYWLIFGWMI